MMATKFRYGQMLFFVLLLVLLTPLTLDEYAPSMPFMVSYFSTTNSSIQLTIPLFMLGLFVSQWICGALSSAYGRRPVLLLTVPVFFVGTLLAIFSSHFTWLLFGRVLQGVGCGCINMVPPALMGEAIEKEKVPKVAALYSLCYSLVPILAPVIGGYIQDSLGWKANFVLMLVFGLFTYFCIWWKFPETHVPSEIDRLQPKRLYENYKTVLTHPQYLAAVVGAFFCWTPIIVFSVLGPFILQVDFGLTATHYGHAALFIGLGFLIGNMLNTYAIKRFSSSKILRTALLSAVIVSGIEIFASFLAPSIFSVIVPTFLLCIAIGVAFPSFFAKAASVFTDLAGIAGALIGCLILLGASLTTTVISLVPSHSAVLLGAIFALLTFCSLLMSLRLKLDNA